MSQTKVCPYCQQKTQPHSEYCGHCGRQLPVNKSQFFTTERVAKSQPEVTGFIPSVEHLGDLSKNTLVLFVVGNNEPIVLRDLEDVILGRPMAEMPRVRTLDLTPYGAIAFGVSRRHVQISYANEMFKVIELGSTNGTSLNGRSLPPARSHRLRPFDQLTLGQLRLLVYFDADPSEQGKNFLLTDKQATKPLMLTLPYLTSTILPYIEALAEIEKISREIRRQPPGNIQVLYIQLGKRATQIRLSLLHADEAIDIVRQWVGPWQHIYADPILMAVQDKKELMPKLHDLVASIADHLAISFSEEGTLLLRQRLLEPISFIAMSSLELTLEALRT